MTPTAQKAALAASANNFDAIRLAAALMVLVSHQYSLTGQPEPGVLGLHSLGGFGVLVFFAISGYLVAQSWLNDPHLLRFAARRLLRIIPGLLALFAACIFILGPLVTPLLLADYFTQPLAIRSILVGSSRLPAIFPGNALPHAVNGSLWTIPLELQCYALLALLGVLGLLRGGSGRWGIWVVGVLLGAIALVYAAWEVRGDGLVAHLQWSLKSRYLLEFGLFFFAGTLLCLWRVLDLPAKQKAILLATACLAAGLAMAFGRVFLAVWLVLPLALVLLGHAATPFLRRAGRFGDVSYGVYIYAFPVQQTVLWLYKDRLGWWSLLALATALTVLLALASWHGVEKPALRLKPHRPHQKTRT